MKKQQLFILSAVILIGLIFSIYQYFEVLKTLSVGAVAVGTPNPGHPLSEIECSADSLCIDTTNNKIGIGTNIPETKLDVKGTVTADNFCTPSGECFSLPISTSSSCNCPTGATCNTLSSGGLTYCVIKWTTVGTHSWTIPADLTSVRYLVVGGGGGSSGTCGGGGGGGGYLTGNVAVTPGAVVAIEVGQGGTSNSSTTGASGGQSKFNNIIADGGGGGGYVYAGTGANGGSGGGGGGTYQNYFATDTEGAGGTATAGNAGGIGKGGSGSYCVGGGGGGGAGSPGQDSRYGYAGNGGSGIKNDITGTNVWYAGGGGGGGYLGIGGMGARSNGGGGNGEYYDWPTSGAVARCLPIMKHGINGTGGGAGGWLSSCNPAPVGGSGIVVVRYLYSAD